MTKHEWKENTEEGLRFYRANFHGRHWTLSSRLKEEEDWTPHDPMRLEDLLLLRDVLWRKYQRRRLPYKQVEQIDRMIEAAGGQVPVETTDAESE